MARSSGRTIHNARRTLTSNLLSKVQLRVGIRDFSLQDSAIFVFGKRWIVFFLCNDTRVHSFKTFHISRIQLFEFCETLNLQNPCVGT